jgi:hypothetical protein
MNELSAAGTPPNNHAAIIVAARMFGWVMLALTGAFIVSNYFTFWQGWPGVPTLFGDLGLFGVSAPKRIIRQPKPGFNCWYMVSRWCCPLFGQKCRQRGRYAVMQKPSWQLPSILFGPHFGRFYSSA